MIDNNRPTGATTDLSTQRADLLARIARAQEALDFADRSERETPGLVATLQAIATSKLLPRSNRRKAARRAQLIAGPTAKTIAATQASAKGALRELQAKLDALPAL